MLFILEDDHDRTTAFKRAIVDRPHHVERTVPEAIAWLRRHKDEVTLYSLDNDLIVPDYDGDEGEGWQLCKWILANAVKRPIICHTTNSPAGEKMKLACSDAEWPFQRVVPYNGSEWIAGAWIGVVEEMLP